MTTSHVMSTSIVIKICLREKKTFCHGKIWNTKSSKRIIKFRNYIPSVNLSLKSWFSEAAAYRCFSKKVFLKFLQYSQENTCAGRCRPSLTEQLWCLLLDLRCRKYFSAESGIYCWESHRFLLRSPLETRVKCQKPKNTFFYRGVSVAALELLCKKRCF